MIQVCGKRQNNYCRKRRFPKSGGALCCRRPTCRAGDRTECVAGAMSSEAEDSAGARPDDGDEAVPR